MRAAALLLATLPFLVAAGVEAAAGPAPTLAWRLAPSDVAVYDVTPVSWKEGKEARGAAAVRTVYGHDLRDGGQYVPVTPARADLPAVLALRLPASGDATSVELRLLPRDAPPTTAKGKVAARARDDGLLEVETSWTFSSAPPTERGTASLWVRGGTAHTVLAFDRAREVVVSSRVTLEYETRPASAKDGKPATVSGTWDLVLREVRRTRYEGFQAHVDAAIDRGVAWLRTQSEPSGAFKPRGEDAFGPTALAILTLVECGVPREDPLVEKAMGWLCLQPAPTSTYHRALALVALERAYTPASEEALLATGRQKGRIRALPPERRDFCRRVGDALLADVASPGSWGYPSAANALLQFDSSNTQYGALGMRAMARLGFEVPDTMWIGLVRHVQVCRERKAPRGVLRLRREGERDPAPGETVAGATAAGEKVPEVAGFSYSTRDPEPTASMTLAGIACLELARHELSSRGSRKWTPPVADEVAAWILGGWAWLDRHWGVDRNAEHPHGSWHLYFLYSLERAGVFSRVRTVGDKDWYFEGAVRLLLQQEKEGSWDAVDEQRLVATCFALLFLKRATPPLTHDEPTVAPK
ncbi:MAG: hypothetical protein IT460_13745 [Planctomycetes bacterium]|nr:hypothetical protein [Planctomycetota bacterium]